MSIATPTFRVFVSSPFEDLAQERNALQREVFPTLATLCRSRGARFQAIDLRWGIRDEAAVDQQTMEICLTEVERCQRTGIKPNFIVLLGNRYGWRPLPARIDAQEFEAVHAGIADSGDQSFVDRWYRRDDNAVPPVYLLEPRTGVSLDADRWRQVEERLHRALCEAAAATDLGSEARVKYEASATHQEILKGLGRTEEDRRHVFAFVRSNERTADPDLDRLKTWLREQLGSNVIDYAPGDVAGLCREVVGKLETSIVDESSRFLDRSALEMEIEAHDAFAADRARHFVGRRAVLDAIAEYLDQSKLHPFVLQGTSGVGKSAIMARTSALAAVRHPDAVVIRRFIGASPESSDALTLLQSLCRQISQKYSGPSWVPATLDELAGTLHDCMTMATPDRPLILFIDGLDQLGTQDPGASLTWLPTDLPSTCRMVISTIELPQRLGHLPHRTIAPMSAAEADAVLSLWLRDAGRTLRPEQRDQIIESIRPTGLPLHLKLAFEEARRWRSFDPPDACVLGTSVDAMVDRLVNRLTAATTHGPVLLGQCVGYLIAARYGLTEDEMLDVLSADDAVWTDFTSRAHFAPPERRLPVIIWSRLSLDLEPYLTERTVPGGTVVTFFQRQMAERFASVLFSHRQSAYHHTLASYFHGQPHWLGANAPNIRKLTELVRQQVGAGLVDDAGASLSDLDFIAAKCAGDLLLDLQQDYRSALRALSTTQETQQDEAGRDRLTRWSHDLMKHARAWSERRDRMTGGMLVDEAPPDLPEAPPSCRMWSEEEIEAARRRSREEPTRLDQLTAFSNFIERESHTLVRFGSRKGFVVQHAFNDASGGPVHDAAANTLRHVDAALLLRRWPSAEVDRNGGIHRTLAGHINSVTGVSVTADGSRAVSSSADGSLRVWDLGSGTCLRTLAIEASLESVCVTADGRLALSASVIISGDGKDLLRVWDLESGSCIRTIDGPGGDGIVQTRLAMTADGRRAVSASSTDATMLVWDLELGACVHVLKGDQTGITLTRVSDGRITSVSRRGGITSVSMTPDGRRAVSADYDNTLRVWDLDNGACLRSIEAHRVTSAGITGDGRRAISASLDATIRVWDVDSGRCVNTLQGHQDGVVSVSVTADGRRAISASHDNTLRVWDLDDGACLRTLECHGGNELTVTADGRLAVTSEAGHTVKVWDLERSASRQMLETNSARINDVSITPDGRHAVSASTDKILRIWDLDSSTCVRRLEGHRDQVENVSVTANGKRVISSSRDKTLRVWDFEGGAGLCVVTGFPAPDERVRRVTPDGRYVVSAGRPDSSKAWPLRVWDLETGTCLQTLESHGGPVTSVCLFRDGRRAVSGSWDKTIRIWDLETGACLRTLRGHRDAVNGVSLIDQGRRAISASQDETVRIWNLESGKCLFTLHSHRAKVSDVSALADGRRAVSVGRDGDLRLWDTNTGARLQSFMGHGPGSYELRVTTDALCACAMRVGQGSALRVQSLESGDEAVLSTIHPISAFALTPNALVVGTTHGDLQVIDLKNFAREALSSKASDADYEQLLRSRLDAARRNKNDREPYFEHLVNFVTYLEDAGRTEEATALRREAESATGEYLLSLRWADPRVAHKQYEWALYLRATDRAAEAEPHLRRAVEIERQVLPPESPSLPHYLNELCTVLVMQGRLLESIPLSTDAWNLQSGRRDMTSARILFVRLAVAMLDHKPTSLYIGILKALLTGPTLMPPHGVEGEWEIDSFVASLRPRLTAPEADLLAALAVVLNKRGSASHLDRYVAWRDFPAVSPNTDLPTT